MISNDLENAQIAAQSVGVIPQKMILQNHPWVDDVEEALDLLEKEKLDKESRLEDEYFTKDTQGDIKDSVGDEDAK